MVETIAELQARVAAQKTLVPLMFGNVDFDVIPERWTEDLSECQGESLQGGTPSLLREALEDREFIERLRAYNMLGDNVCDQYAALMPQYTFRGLMTMLSDACDHGVENIIA
ncbi:MAG TPA: DUF2236 domain-containing protein, partial [Caulobacteraceae bacterium]|nr:DUF2236 domain-containing protein [Caulobacteraceae bacterium]